MRLTSPPRISVSSREDKEAKLKEFIAEAISLRHDENPAAISTIVSLVARATDSPAARALFAMAGELAAAGITVRVVLFETEALSDETIQPSLYDIAAIEVRQLHDQRFAAAHEQLSLGAGRVWIGDCMRRDPAKRDAFESYHTGQAAIAAYADASFARLWQKAAVSNRVRYAAVAAEVLLAGQQTPDAPPLATRR
mgnify:CR=1 FL=1